MKTSIKVALGGAVAALSLVLMLLTAVIPFGTFAFPVFAGMLLVVIVIELGYGPAVSVYVVTSVLSYLLVPDKEAMLVYIAFLGYYPIIKSLIERISNKIVQYIVKLAVFNAAMIGAYFVAIKLLAFPDDSFKLFGVYLPLVFLLIGNLFFVLYDFCVTKIVTIYLRQWRHKINKNTKL